MRVNDGLIIEDMILVILCLGVFSIRHQCNVMNVYNNIYYRSGVEIRFWFGNLEALVRI